MTGTDRDPATKSFWPAYQELGQNPAGVRLRCWFTIKSAILGCRLEEPGCGHGLTIKVLKIYKNYAKATVGSADGSGETETAFLEKKENHWIVLDRGTGADPTSLGLPEEVW